MNYSDSERDETSYATLEKDRENIMKNEQDAKVVEKSHNKFLFKIITQKISRKRKSIKKILSIHMQNNLFKVYEKGGKITGKENSLSK